MEEDLKDKQRAVSKSARQTFSNNDLSIDSSNGQEVALMMSSVKGYQAGHQKVSKEGAHNLPTTLRMVDGILGAGQRRLFEAHLSPSDGLGHPQCLSLGIVV
jgi:hypothetical protein